MQMANKRSAPAKRTGLNLREATRDRINLMRARFTVANERSFTQDEALAAMMNFWDYAAQDDWAVEYAAKKGR